MFNIIRNIISKKGIIIAVVILLPMALYFLNKAGEKDSAKAIEPQFQAVVELANRLNIRWMLGDKEGKVSSKNFDCDEFESLAKDTPSEFFQCNPIYFKCYLENEFQDSRFKVINHKNEKHALRVRLLDKQTKEEFSLKFEKHCHEKFLPTNIYMSSSIIADEYKWDNYLYNIFIDKYYATKSSVVTDPILNFTPKQMQEYCLEQGKILLEERYLDAASFFPDSSKAFYKHPYPWSKSHRSFLSEEKELNSTNCLNAFVKGCDEYFLFDNYNSIGSSWMGVNHTLGSYAEYVRGTFNARANLKVSSMELSTFSWWHQLGRRGFYSDKQKRFVEEYTNKSTEENETITGVAFRCALIK